LEWIAVMGDMPSIEPDEEQPESRARAREPAPGKALPWQKGESGNPAGRKWGSRNKASLLAETLLDGETERITRKCVEMALEGNEVALRLCMERVLSPKKSRPLRFKLSVLETVADAQLALAQIVAGMADGTILVDEGSALCGAVNAFLKSIEIAELETRLLALEQASAEQRPGAHFNA
jgi:hypothetical protein